MLTQCDYWWNDEIKFGLVVSVAATEEPVSVAEARQHCRIDSHEEDLWVLNSISAARELCETFTKRRFVSTTLKLTLDRFPSMFYLPSPPLVSVTTVKYRDAANVLQTLSSSDYEVDAATEPGRLALVSGSSWPTTYDRMNAVEVTYVAGYGSATAVPYAIKQAIMLTVAHWNENREAVSQTMMHELPLAAKSLLRAHSWGYLP